MSYRYVLKSRREIKKMRAAGLVVWEAHQTAAKMIGPGVSTAEINQVYIDVFARHGAAPLFLNYGATEERPPFPAEICASINDEVVHGIPSPDRVLVEGDTIAVDTGCRLDGWCGDAAVTHAIGVIDDESQRLLKATQETLDLAIEQLGKCQRWSEVAKSMEEFVHDAGFSVVQEMVGHGIGKDLHEPPQVPNYFAASLIEENEDFDLKPGLVLAVEPMVNAGTNEIFEEEDGWTIVTGDGKPSAHFEHTLAITKDGVVRLTGPPSDEELESMPDWLHESSTWLRW
ncbi:MAG: type I methionyl aminopeptidase [Planctomycetota bacterium]